MAIEKFSSLTFRVGSFFLSSGAAFRAAPACQEEIEGGRSEFCPRRDEGRRSPPEAGEARQSFPLPLGPLP